MQLRDRLLPYLYLLPAYACLLVVFLFPIVQLIQLSFYRVRGAEKSFIGLANFAYLFNDPVFWQAIRNNALLLICVPILVILSIILSSLLFSQMPGWKVYRICIFLPFNTAIPIIGLIFSQIFTFNGLLNTILRGIGLNFLAADWLGKSRFALPTVMFVIIWRELGFGAILFLARLMSMEEELLEASRLEGANWAQQLIFLLIPHLRTVIEFYILISFINLISWVFPYIWVITAGGPANSTVVTEVYIFQQGFRFNMMGIASACSTILFILIFAFIFLQFRFRGVMAIEKK